MNQWFLEEFAMLKKESAGEFDREDPTFVDLALSKIFEEHFSEIEVENDFIEEAFILVFHKTPPWDLRDIAAEAREQDLQIGHYLELIADHRERKRLGSN
jgi:hypothetical protein